MNQTIALQGRYPQVDIAGIERDAQGARARDFALQNAPARSELEGLKLKNDINAEQGMTDFNAAAGAGDPDPYAKLKGQPALQAKMYQLFDGMPPQELMAVQKKSSMFARAAQHVMSMPPGAKQTEAWNAAAQVLKQGGAIDDKQYNEMIRSGPNELMINEAMTADQWVQDYVHRRSQRTTYANDPQTIKLRQGLIQAQIDKLKTAGGGNGKTEQSARLQAERIFQTRLAAFDAQTGLQKNSPEYQTEVAKIRKNIWDSVGLTDLLNQGPAAPAVAPAPGDGTDPDIEMQIDEAIGNDQDAAQMIQILQDQKYPIPQRLQDLADQQAAGQ